MATYLDMEETPRPVLAEADRALVQALQLNGRASFRELGQVLGVSDQTVARQLTRLRSAGTVRLLGLTDPLRLGETPWFVRVRCTPDAADSIGRALARRTDTTWVNLMAGGTEISCSVRTPDTGRGDALLLQRLPHTPRVVDVTAHCLLHIFFGQNLSTITKTGPLRPEQAAALAPQPSRQPGGDTDPADAVRLDQGDRLMLDLLARDGRAPTGELAQATGWSPSTVRRRMAELVAEGVLYFDVDYHPDVLHRSFRAALWLEVDPAQLAAAGAALAAHPEISFAAAVTGAANLYAAVDVASVQVFYRYVTESVAALPGLRHTVTTPIHRTLKGAGPYR
ncbi:Lrp/AsnC family transcriptional regulator [Streptomyces sp. NPDC046887]|uniref:Lrp/AsnC family transcriptional regulator n=1 Tax=Streptomyces sp. NPDC046887 TaxID=3155472 RepID=UPI0034007267